MRIRIKEFTWHLIIMLIIFLYMIIVNLIYTNYVNDTLNESSRLDSSSLATNEVANLNNCISNVLSNYNNKKADYKIVTRTDHDVNEQGYFLEAKDTTLYCYIQIDEKEK